MPAWQGLSELRWQIVQERLIYLLSQTFVEAVVYLTWRSCFLNNFLEKKIVL